MGGNNVMHFYTKANDRLAFDLFADGLIVLKNLTRNFRNVLEQLFFFLNEIFIILF